MPRVKRKLFGESCEKQEEGNGQRKKREMIVFTPKTPIELTPRDVLRSIFRTLGILDMLSLRLVCKKFNQCLDESFFKAFLTCPSDKKGLNLLQTIRENFDQRSIRFRIVESHDMTEFINFLKLCVLIKCTVGIASLTNDCLDISGFARSDKTYIRHKIPIVMDSPMGDNKTFECEFSLLSLLRQTYIYCFDESVLCIDKLTCKGLDSINFKLVPFSRTLVIGGIMDGKNLILNSELVPPVSPNIFFYEINLLSITFEGLSAIYKNMQIPEDIVNVRFFSNGNLLKTVAVDKHEVLRTIEFILAKFKLDNARNLHGSAQISSFGKKLCLEYSVGNEVAFNSIFLGEVIEAIEEKQQSSESTNEGEKV